MEKVRKNFEKIARCSVSLSLCNMICQNRQSFESLEYISDTCSYISKNCASQENKNCSKGSKYCTQAVEKLISGDTQGYLDFCKKALSSCPKSAEYLKKKKPKINKRSIYQA